MKVWSACWLLTSLVVARDDVQCAVHIQPKRVLVTGISGMIGSHVARELLQNPCRKVYGLVRPRSDLAALRGLLSNIILVVGDIIDATCMENVLRDVRPHYVYHFAAQAINGISYRLPHLTSVVNVEGTQNLLEGLRKLNFTATRVLLAGSSTEYGKTADEWYGPLPESAPLKPVSPYGVSKVATEMLGRQYFAAYGMPIITARYFIHVGVGGTDSLAIHQFCRHIAQAELGIRPAVIEHGNLHSKRDMTSAIDSAPISVMLAERGVAGESYNMGSGFSMSIARLLHIAIRQSTIKITTRDDQSRYRVYDETTLLADNTKVRNLTGWVPGTDMKKDVELILNYWRSKEADLYPSGHSHASGIRGHGHHMGASHHSRVVADPGQ